MHEHLLGSEGGAEMHIANTDVTFCDGAGITTINLDEKVTLRNRYNQIPHPALDTKRERNTYHLEFKIRTARAESQEAMAIRLS